MEFIGKGGLFCIFFKKKKKKKDGKDEEEKNQGGEKVAITKTNKEHTNQTQYCAFTKEPFLVTYLACAHLVECHECKRLRQHRARKILLCQHERNQDCAESELRNKGQRLESNSASRRWDG